MLLKTRYEVQYGHLKNDYMCVDVYGEYDTIEEARVAFDSIDIKTMWMRGRSCSNGRSVEDMCKAIVENVYEWNDCEWVPSHQEGTIDWAEYTLEDYEAGR